MNEVLKFFMSKDGLVAVGGLVLLGAVSHFNTENAVVNFVARSGNLLLFIYILWRAAGRSIVSFFAERRAGIAAELEKLRLKKEAAERSLQDLQARMAHLEGERQAILDESRKQAEAIKANILARAEQEAAKVREQAVRSASSQARAELQALRAELADEFASVVEAALKERLTPDNHAKLIDNSLKKVVLH